MNTINYYYILGSKQFLFNEEPLEEMLRERAENYIKNQKNLNFWILPNPTFLNLPEYENVRKKLPPNNENIVGIISTNKSFITWLKLRLNNVLVGEISKTENSPLNPLGYKGF